MKIAKNIEKKITKELSNMLENDRDKYNEFYKEFGTQMKISLYNSFGANKDTLEDLLMFYSSKEDKLVTLKEYLDNMSESQDKIYYAVGESIDKIKLLPQVDEVLEKGYEVLYFELLICFVSSSGGASQRQGWTYPHIGR